MTTSLMGSCGNDPNACPLGSLTYRTDFEPIATGCFGPGGSYRMAQLSNVWIFLAHNAGDEPLDFMVSFQHMTPAEAMLSWTVTLAPLRRCWETLAQTGLAP